MSLLNIRIALEKHLASLEPALETALENQEFTPKNGVAHQRAYVLPANSESMGFEGNGISDTVRESGIFQVSLFYPLGTGSGDALVRAEAILSHFRRGLSLSSNGVTVIINKRGSVAPAQQDGKWYVIAVSIPYYSNIYHKE